MPEVAGYCSCGFETARRWHAVNPDTTERMRAEVIAALDTHPCPHDAPSPSSRPDGR